MKDQALFSLKNNKTSSAAVVIGALWLRLLDVLLIRERKGE